MNIRISHYLRRTVSAAVLISIAGPSANAVDQLPASEAGVIGAPTGKIAFIRESNIWVMDADGANPFMVAEVGNADGKLSWSPGGKRIVYTRSGQVNLRSPQNDGGVHKVYDVFIAYLDSAKTKNLFYTTPLTSELGSRDPEWSADGQTIVYTHDFFANTVNAQAPNWQVSTMSPDGANQTTLRKDWRNLTDLFITPSMNANGDIAFVLFFDQRPQGTAVLNRTNFMVSLDSIRAKASRMKDRIGPSWSPDGKWLAYVSNTITDGGLYITTADLSRHYLVHQPPGSSLSTRPPGWSPNSKWLTFSTGDGAIWICDITGQNLKRLTNNGTDWSPAWSKGPVK